MGSSGSKVAKGASAAARRQYPSTASIPSATNSSISGTSNAPAPPSAPQTSPANAASPTTQPRPGQVHPQANSSMPRASTTKTPHVDLDGRDPDFGARLGRIGPVQPTHPGTEPIQTISASPSSTSTTTTATTNPAVLIVQARERYTRAFDSERESLGRASFGGRTLISAGELKTLLAMRDGEGGGSMSQEEIERHLRLKKGLVARLGGRELVRNV